MASFLEDLSQAVAEIRNDLVCQNCKNHPRPGKPKWYRCLNQKHQICQGCIEKHGMSCRVCGSGIPREHCKTAETLLSVKGWKFNCLNTQHGCKEILNENALEDHESECIYRQVPCLAASQIARCKTKVTFQDVLKHFEEKHGGFTDTKAPITENVVSNSTFWPPKGVRFTLKNQVFVLLRRSDGKIAYNWLYLIGSPNEARNFSYTLKFFGSNGNATTFEGKVASVDESFEELFEAGKCFIYHMEAFKKQDGKFEYSLQIRNLKEEVKDENYESGISDNDEDDEASKV